MSATPMQAHRRELTVGRDGTLVLDDLPIRAGDRVEVIVLVTPSPLEGTDCYPSWGRPITYIDPFEPVAEDDWEALS